MNLIAGLLMMITLWQPQQSDLCPNAPLPRLTIGERAEVAPGISQLRLRALPAVGTGEVLLLFAGYEFEVLAGPSCNGGYSWWRIKLDSGASGWVAEGTWTQYFLRPVEPSTNRCEQNDVPWLHLLLTATCRVMAGL